MLLAALWVMNFGVLTTLGIDLPVLFGHKSVKITLLRILFLPYPCIRAAYQELIR